MKQGNATIGSDGESINLHHLTQADDSSIVELTNDIHYSNYATLHINPNTMPSGINRQEFDNWRKSYWRRRAKEW